MFRRLPVAWLQMSHGRTKLFVALLGVLFADLLMFVQLGFLNALYDSATKVQQQLGCELVVISPQSEAMYRMHPFPRRQLYRLLGHREVEGVAPLYTGVGAWRNPETGTQRSIFVFGMEPFTPALNVPGLSENFAAMRETDVCLFDEASRPEFGPIKSWFEGGKPVVTELNRRHMKVAGIVLVGASFAADGNLVMSDSNFFRAFPNRDPGAIDVGLIRLKAGADLVGTQADVRKLLGSDYKVMTVEEFIAFEKLYWAQNAPIGFIFTLGTILGFVVGFIITYQILYTDVSNHLSQYATLKAIGYTDGYLRKVVISESLILSVLGFVPACGLSMMLYQMASEAIYLPLQMSWNRAIQVLLLTMVMCVCSGLAAMRRLKSADPAEVF